MALEDVAREAGVDPICITLTAEFEGCLKKVGPDLYGPYLCPARVPTIGIGTTVWPDGRKVSMGDRPISRARAEEALAYDFARRYMPGVDRARLPWKYGNMRNACGSFTYNVGVGGFQKSTLAHLIRNKQYDRAADEFLRWTRGGGRVLPGLVRRRKAERKLFLTPGGTLPNKEGALPPQPQSVPNTPLPQLPPPSNHAPSAKPSRLRSWLRSIFRR